MTQGSTIAAASAALRATLEAACGEVAGGAAGALAVVDGIEDLTGPGTRLLLQLYLVGEDATGRQQPQRPPSGSTRPVPTLALELHYLVAANAGKRPAAEALLEHAWRTLSACPVLVVPTMDQALVAAVHGFTLEQSIALFGGLRHPVRPAFGCRVALPMRPSPPMD